MKCWKKKFK